MKNGFDCGEIVIIEDYNCENCVEVSIVLGYAKDKPYYNEDTNRLVAKGEDEFINDLQREAKKADKGNITLDNFKVMVQHICFIDQDAFGMKETEDYVKAMYRKELNKVLNLDKLHSYSGFRLKSSGHKFEDYSNYLVKSAMMNKIIREYLTYVIAKDKLLETLEKLNLSYKKKLIHLDDLVETKNFEIGKVYIREEKKGGETVYRFMLCVNCNNQIWNFLTLKDGVEKENFMKEYLAVTSEITTTNMKSLRRWLAKVRKIRYGQYVLYKEKYKYYGTTIGIQDKNVCAYL